MAHLVLTVVGDDRAGLVSALADTVTAHGGNWERSELAELAGVFAGIVLVSVPDEHLTGLADALDGMAGLLRVTAHPGAQPQAPASTQDLTVTVLGNDRPGIVRDVTSAIAANSLSIDSFRSRTLEAPMAGGTLFEATAEVRIHSDADAGVLTAALERLAGEIQVDLTIG
ncbi:glycine cleavage system protein R [Microbacterium invictum]|uniref:Glycine cleavage system regulatory protein n=1 Tax=Microbacterium invictum TaxID=515415 RepID=A0AA40SMX7_9MICO|nr:MULTISPECIES: ACT domain-containing protein [Microbacterium]MBB4139148.1 glycine cleavage system regulatory protein [Microbacterium invictum]